MSQLIDFSHYKKQHNIVDIAMNRYGFRYNKPKSTKSCIQLENGSDVILIRKNTLTQEYYYTNRNNNYDKGDIITFILKRENWNLKEHKNQLLSILDNNYTDTNQIEIDNHKRPFDPSLLSECRNFNYLHSRNISSDTLSSTLFENRIQSFKVETDKGTFYNLAFPLYDINQNIVGADLRNKNYKGMAESSNKINSVWTSNHHDHIKQIIIAESPIDLLSHYELDQKDKQDNLYLSTGGQITQGQLELIRHFQATNNAKIICASDNDYMGWKYACMIANCIDSKIDIDYEILNHKEKDKLTLNIRGSFQPDLSKLFIRHQNEDIANSTVNFSLSFENNLSNMTELFRFITQTKEIQAKAERSIPFPLNENCKDWNKALEEDKRQKDLENQGKKGIGL